MPDRETNGPYAFHTHVWPGTSKLIEECGELVQVLAKLIMVGGGQDHFDGSNLYNRIEEELGDLEAAIIFFKNQNYGHISNGAVRNRRFQKLAIFNMWHAEGEE